MEIPADRLGFICVPITVIFVGGLISQAGVKNYKILHPLEGPKILTI